MTEKKGSYFDSVWTQVSVVGHMSQSSDAQRDYW